MAEPVEHLGRDDTHPDEWRLGITCDECQQSHAKMMDEKFGEKLSVFWNIQRLKNDNAGHYTQRELRNEIYDAARESGEDIGRAR